MLSIANMRTPATQDSFFRMHNIRHAGDYIRRMAGCRALTVRTSSSVVADEPARLKIAEKARNIAPNHSKT